jgi:hypothetical protein
MPPARTAGSVWNTRAAGRIDAGLRWSASMSHGMLPPISAAPRRHHADRGGRSRTDRKFQLNLNPPVVGRRGNARDGVAHCLGHVARAFAEGNKVATAPPAAAGSRPRCPSPLPPTPALRSRSGRRSRARAIAAKSVPSVPTVHAAPAPAPARNCPSHRITRRHLLGPEASSTDRWMPSIQGATSRAGMSRACPPVVRAQGREQLLPSPHQHR